MWTVRILSQSRFSHYFHLEPRCTIFNENFWSMRSVKASEHRTFFYIAWTDESNSHSSDKMSVYCVLFANWSSYPNQSAPNQFGRHIDSSISETQQTHRYNSSIQFTCKQYYTIAFSTAETSECCCIGIFRPIFLDWFVSSSSKQKKQIYFEMFSMSVHWGYRGTRACFYFA